MNYYRNVYLELDTEMEFGKYQGQRVEIILENDPEYLNWLIDQGVDVSDEVYECITAK